MKFISAVRRGFAAILFAGCLWVVAGCQNDARHVSDAEVEKSNADRLAAIDADPKLTPEQKQALKDRLTNRPGGQTEGRATGGQ
jgi:hypothetical protein